MEEIHPIFQQYIENFQESDAIRKEIRESHKKNKLRLQQLKTENQRLETILLDYMIKNDLPGLRKNGFILLCDEKPKHANKQKKQERMEEIFRRNQMDASSPLYRELKMLMIDSRLEDAIERRIRCQRWTEKK